jgi:hypothetical protein
LAEVAHQVARLELRVHRSAPDDFDCARRLIAGIETMHLIKKGQLDGPDGQALSAADQFYRSPSDLQTLRRVSVGRTS